MPGGARRRELIRLVALHLEKRAVCNPSIQCPERRVTRYRSLCLNASESAMLRSGQREDQSASALALRNALNRDGSVATSMNLVT